MLPISTMLDLDLQRQRVLMRVDLNVPMDDTGRITNDARIQAVLPTIRLALERGACVILMSHLGRPVEGHVDPRYTLAPVAHHLSELLKRPVPLIADWSQGVSVESGQLVLLENVRFLAGEKVNDDELAKRLAALCDIYVNDAFATAHRAHASTHGVAKYAKTICAGPLLLSELDALTRALHAPARPTLAIVGGAKVSTKLMVLEKLLDTVDQLIVGGGIANTFLVAKGIAVGASLVESKLVAQAERLLNKAKQRNVKLPMPVDVVVANECSASAKVTLKAVTEVRPNEMILDIGPRSVEIYAELCHKAGTIIWNGPMGVFEYEQFAEGTRGVAEAVGNSSAFSLAGGGDTLAAIDQFGVRQQLSYISTGGGAFLEFVEGKALPAVSILKQRASVPINSD